jgi:hypothetical protein
MAAVAVGVATGALGLQQDSVFTEADTFFGGVIAGVIIQPVVMRLFGSDDEFYAPEVFQEAGITLGRGRGPYADYGRQIATTFYKQRITIGQR